MSHLDGEVMMFNGRLTAMGGHYTRRVDVYVGDFWDDDTIPQIGYKDEDFGQRLWGFSSLAIKSHLFVFGKI